MASCEKADGVLYLNSCAAASGGAERSLLELLAALPDSRRFATVAAPPGGGLAEELAAMRIPCLPAPMRRLTRSRNPFVQAQFLVSLARVAPILRSFAKRQSTRIVHANGTTAAIYAAHAFGAQGPPIVWHCRDGGDLAWVGRWLGRRVAAAIAISQRMETHLLGSLASERIHLIRNGVDEARLAAGGDRDRLRDAWGISPDAPLIGMAAHLAPWKRHDLFLAAAARVRQTWPAARFVVAGGTPNGAVSGYRRELDALAARLDVAEATIFLGDWRDMGGFHRAIDILCHPSVGEPFGRVVAEAMMAGKPVVTLADTGVAECIADGADGLLARQADAGELAEKLAVLLARPELREAIGAAAAATARREFAIARVADHVGRLYDDLLAFHRERGERREG